MSHTKVDVDYRIIGSQHDPYGRTTYTATVGGHHIRLIMCGLTGIALENDGAVQPFKGRDAVQEFERLIGCTLETVEEELAEQYEMDPMGPMSRYI